MSKQEQRRLYIIVAIAIAAVVLLLLFGRKAGGTTIVQQGDVTVSGGTAVRHDFTDLPPLNIPDADTRVGSRGCSVCWLGYSQISVPVRASAPPSVTEIYNFFLSGQEPAPTIPPNQLTFWARG